MELADYETDLSDDWLSDPEWDELDFGLIEEVLADFLFDMDEGDYF